MTRANSDGSSGPLGVIDKEASFFLAGGGIVIGAGLEHAVGEPGCDDLAALHFGQHGQPAPHEAPGSSLLAGARVARKTLALVVAALDLVKNFVGDGSSDMRPQIRRVHGSTV